jgi:hypothetical protein
MRVDYGEPVNVISAEIDSPPAIVLDTIYAYFQKQPKYEIKNKDVSGGMITVQTKTDYPLRYIFIIDRSSTAKCTLAIRGLIGFDYRLNRESIPENVFNEMENAMEKFMQEIKGRVKKKI